MSRLSSGNTKSKYLNFSSLFLIVFAMLAAIGFLQIFNLDKKVEAAQDDTELYGDAWSDTVGWISFNSRRSESSPSSGPEYSVVVKANGDVEGAAWSSIGWIKFGGLSGFPDSGGSASDVAITLNGGKQQGEFSGWARACAGTVNGDCSTMESRTDGWDGWILFADTEFHPSPVPDGSGGVTYVEDEQKIVGNAWGGPVIGWINFYDVYFGSPEEGGFDYALSNASPDYEKQIEQGSIGNVGLRLDYIAGAGENVTLSVTSVSPPGYITVAPPEINNPCLNLSSSDPECISSVRITVDPATPIIPDGFYEFTVDAESSLTSVNKSTLVRFEVVAEGSLADPEVSCGVVGGQTIFFPGDPVMWTATVVNPNPEFDVYKWRGENVGASCDNSVTCQVTYTTAGPKAPEVSIDAGGIFTECDPKVYVIPPFFRIFEF